MATIPAMPIVNPSNVNMPLTGDTFLIVVIVVLAGYIVYLLHRLSERSGELEQFREAFDKVRELDLDDQICVFAPLGFKTPLFALDEHRLIQIVTPDDPLAVRWIGDLIVVSSATEFSGEPVTVHRAQNSFPTNRQPLLGEKEYPIAEVAILQAIGYFCETGQWPE